MSGKENQNREFEELYNDIDLQDVESLLSKQLESEFAELSFLEEERKNIGNLDNLGEVVRDVVWEQLMNHIDATVGGDFAERNIASRNDKIDYQRRYDNGQSNVQGNEYGSIKTNAGGRKKPLKTGKQSPKEEVFKISGKALKTVVISLLRGFLREVTREFDRWLRKDDKNIVTLLKSIKHAIINFARKLRMHLTNAGIAGIETIARAIGGPIVRTVKKFINTFKRGIKMQREVSSLIKKLENRENPDGVLLLEIGKIVITGASVFGTLTLSEIIEKSLMAIPAFAFEIPLLGTLSNLVGLLLGALIAGIIGAILVHLINRLIAKKRKAKNAIDIIEKKNKILTMQEAEKADAAERVKKSKETASADIKERHALLKMQMEEAFEIVAKDSDNDETGEIISVTENSNALLQIQKELEALL